MSCRALLAVAVVLAACTSESSAPPSEPIETPEPTPEPPLTVRESIQTLAEVTGESVDALSQDPCIIGCAGAAVVGCQPVKEACDSTLVAQFAGIWMTCTEAIQAGCGGGLGLLVCAQSCRARAAR